MSARAVTDATFETEVINNEKTVLVDFWQSGVARVAPSARSSTRSPLSTPTSSTS